MNSRGIPFSGPMVRALIAGTKTQTRRIIKPQPVCNGFGKPGEDTDFEIPCYEGSYPPSAMLWPDEKGGMLNGDAGHPWLGVDQLWVREAWRVTKGYDAFDAAKIWIASGGDMTGCIHYEADGVKPSWAGRYRHARFMPRWSSRITLEIVDVCAERLNKISEADAKAEGVESVKNFPEQTESYLPYRAEYGQLWERINGPGTWDLNPWVWKIEFKRITP